MTTAPHPTWMLFVAQQSRYLHPRCTPRLVKSWFGSVAKRTLDGRDLGEDEEDVAGRTPRWCVACLLGQWMAMSLPANASTTTEGSPPPMPMGGRRRDL